MSLHRDATGDPRLEWPDLDDDRPAVRQLGTDDLGKVTRPEQDTRHAGAERPPAPVRYHRVIQHNSSLPGRSGAPGAAVPGREELLAVTGLIEDGKLMPVVDRTYPLADTAEGLRYVEQGHAPGKVGVAVA